MRFYLSWITEEWRPEAVSSFFLPSSVLIPFNSCLVYLVLLMELFGFLFILDEREAAARGGSSRGEWRAWRSGEARRGKWRRSCPAQQGKQRAAAASACRHTGIQHFVRWLKIGTFCCPFNSIVAVGTFCCLLTTFC